MKVLIFGSKGFIGNNLAIYLEGKGHEVWGADILADNTHHKRYFHIGDSSDNYYSIFEHVIFDICINCSGAASVPESLQDPGKDYFLNSVNVFKILVAIMRYQPNCKFINLSSAAVYGDPKILPIREDSMLDPLSPYGFHKMHSEQICKEFYELYGIHTCSLRIFSAYGDGLKKQLFWDLYLKAQTGKPFLLYGTGFESRDFIYILDLVKAIEIVSQNSDFKADIINIANGKGILIKDAVSIFFSFFWNEVVYSFSNEGRKGDPVNWEADINKLKNFGYTNSFSLEAGLSLYSQWIKLNCAVG